MAYTLIQEYNITIGNQTTLDIQHRCRVCVSRFCRYVAGGGGNPSANKLAWAKSTLGNAQWTADQVWSLVVEDGNFPAAQSDYINGDDASGDTALQPIVETALSLVFGAGW